MGFLKRMLDISLSLFGLVIAVPIMFVIAVFVRLESPGRVIFSQQRLGQAGKYFSIHKFRKFPSDWGTKGAGVTIQGDVRMTSVGAFLERTKLDELPQLWNILKGEMSFVGPRPESVRYEHLFAGEFTKLLKFRPGIFGPNQVAFRNESAMYPRDRDPEEFYESELFPKKARADIEYFENSDFVSDFSWIVKGVFGTLGGTIDWKKFFRQHAFILLVDLILFQFAWFAAHEFRFGFPIEGKQIYPYLTGCWLLPLLVIPSMYVFGCYRHPVRYFGVSDLLRLLLAVPALWFFATLIEIYFYHRYMSISVSVLALVLFIAAILTPRIVRRERWLRSHDSAEGLVVSEGRRILVYGANKKGHALVKFFEQGFSSLKVIGFVDEDESVKGRFLSGLKVLGHWRDVDMIRVKFDFNELWICEELSLEQRGKITEWCADNRVVDKHLTELFSL